ncbi:hypothetical protein B0H12DRAFT_1109702 [Mycena haematopus]|nr:hypothetical protein B0H12DRAFT_1109702 [Mycena haematopus]
MYLESSGTFHLYLGSFSFTMVSICRGGISLFALCSSRSIRAFGLADLQWSRPRPIGDRPHQRVRCSVGADREAKQAPRAL